MKNNKHVQSFNEHQDKLNISDVGISKNYFIKQFNKLPKCYHDEWVDIDEIKKVYSYDDIQKFIK